MLNMRHLSLKRVFRMVLTTLIRKIWLLYSRCTATLLMICWTGETYCVGEMIGKYHEVAKSAGVIVSVLSFSVYNERLKILLTSQSFYLRLGLKADCLT